MKLLLSTLLLSIATLLSANNDPCNCNQSLEAAKVVAKGGPYNLSCAAYIDYQITHLQFYLDITSKLLSSGHQTGIMKEQLGKVASAAQAGIGKLMKEKGKTMSMKMKGREAYQAQLGRIHAIGTQEFKRTSKAMYAIINGGKSYQATAEGPPVDSGCSSQRTDMRQACLNALQQMQECGFYDSLGATKLQDDQDYSLLVTRYSLLVTRYFIEYAAIRRCREFTASMVNFASPIVMYPKFLQIKICVSTS